MSENSNLFRPEWTEQDCINELLRIAEIDETKVISRNYFRNHADCSEATWNRYFGTFHEFKRQAGIVLSRHQHKHERDIAKHASKDNQRVMMVEKTSYEGKYKRDSDRRFQSILNVSDLHDINCDPFLRRMLIEAAKRVQPEKIVLNGDTFDMPEFGKYTQDPRLYDPIKRIKWVHDLLTDLRKAAPNAEFIMVEGNHEFRLIRHLTEATPAMVTVLADLHGFTVPKLLGLDKFEVNYIARMDLTAFREIDIKSELKKNYSILYDAVLFHHFPEGSKMGYPGTNGHHHRHLVHSYYSPAFGPYEWHQTGAGHVRSASYCAGEQWSNGFLVVHVDTATRHSSFEYVDVRDFCMFGGKFYQRSEAESVYAIPG